MDSNWHEMIAEADFPEDGRATAMLNGWHVLLVREDDEYFAVNDRCTHAAAHISGGRIRRGAVMCPLHGARFEIKSGRCIGGAYKDLRTFETIIRGGVICVQLPEEKPGLSELPVETN